MVETTDGDKEESTKVTAQLMIKEKWDYQGQMEGNTTQCLLYCKIKGLQWNSILNVTALTIRFPTGFHLYSNDTILKQFCMQEWDDPPTLNKSLVIKRWQNLQVSFSLLPAKN